MGLGPGATPGAEHAAAAQQELAQTMPRPHQVQPRIVAAPAQVAHRLLVLARRTHHGQQARARQLGQLASIPPVRLDLLAGPDRDHRRCHHVAGQPLSLKLPLQRVATGPGLVDAADRAAALVLQLPRQALHRRRLVRHPPLHRPRLALDQHRHRDVPLVDVHPDEGGRLAHRPAPFFVCGSGTART